MKVGDLVKYRNAKSTSGIDRDKLIGVVKEVSEYAHEYSIKHHTQVYVHWSIPLPRSNSRSWWVYVEDLYVISEI